MKLVSRVVVGFVVVTAGFGVSALEHGGSRSADSMIAKTAISSGQDFAAANNLKIGIKLGEDLGSGNGCLSICSDVSDTLYPEVKDGGILAGGKKFYSKSSHRLEKNPNGEVSTGADFAAGSFQNQIGTEAWLQSTPGANTTAITMKVVSGGLILLPFMASALRRIKISGRQV